MPQPIADLDSTITIILQTAAPAILLGTQVLVPLARCLIFLPPLLIDHLLGIWRNRLRHDIFDEKEQVFPL